MHAGEQKIRYTGGLKVLSPEQLRTAVNKNTDEEHPITDEELKRIGFDILRSGLSLKLENGESFSVLPGQAAGGPVVYGNRVLNWLANQGISEVVAKKILIGAYARQCWSIGLGVWRQLGLCFALPSLSMKLSGGSGEYKKAFLARILGQPEKKITIKGTKIEVESSFGSQVSYCLEKRKRGANTPVEVLGAHVEEKQITIIESVGDKIKVRVKDLEIKVTGPSSLHQFVDVIAGLFMANKADPGDSLKKMLEENLDLIVSKYFNFSTLMKEAGRLGFLTAKEVDDLDEQARPYKRRHATKKLLSKHVSVSLRDFDLKKIKGSCENYLSIPGNRQSDPFVKSCEAALLLIKYLESSEEKGTKEKIFRTALTQLFKIEDGQPLSDEQVVINQTACRAHLAGKQKELGEWRDVAKMVLSIIALSLTGIGIFVAIGLYAPGSKGRKTAKRCKSLFPAPEAPQPPARVIGVPQVQ